MKFRATILLAGKTATGIEVPPEVVAGLESGKKPPVRVTIGVHTYRTTIAARGERFLIPLSAENARAPGSPPATRWTSRSSWIPSPVR
jgi:hypothetical protein